jgi:hypothetical protein
MDENRDREAIVSLIESLTARNAGESTQLELRIRRHCWPGGPADRTAPAALEWVRRWGPRGVVPPAPNCSCADGRCAVCN